MLQSCTPLALSEEGRPSRMFSILVDVDGLNKDFLYCSAMTIKNFCQAPDLSTVGSGLVGNFVSAVKPRLLNLSEILATSCQYKFSIFSRVWLGRVHCGLVWAAIFWWKTIIYLVYREGTAAYRDTGYHWGLITTGEKAADKIIRQKKKKWYPFSIMGFILREYEWTCFWFWCTLLI